MNNNHNKIIPTVASFLLFNTKPTKIVVKAQSGSQHQLKLLWAD